MNSSTNKDKISKCLLTDDVRSPVKKSACHQPSANLFQLDLVQCMPHFPQNFGNTSPVTTSQSLHEKAPRPHSLYPRGGWSFQLSLARCMRKKPLMLAAGYLMVSDWPKQADLNLIKTDVSKCCHWILREVI